MSNSTNDGAPAGKPDNAALIRLFGDTRKRLIETGTRNRLVHVNRANARSNVVNVINERSDEVHAYLATGKVMRFLAIGRDKEDESEWIRLADAGEAGFEEGRQLDSQLETRMGPDALQKRLLKIAHEAQTAEEESGVNILYLALGFLTWIEDKTQTERHAPLVLLPVELVRNQRTSTYDVRLREDEVLTNLPLQQRLKDDFGFNLPELEVDEEWHPALYFSQVSDAVAGKTGWKIDRDGMQLGFFSFSKLLMYRDLAIDAWPAGAVAAHALTRGLLFEGFEAEPPAINAQDRLDAVLTPENMFHVVDADASQALVIEEVRRGRNMVVQGPPGTGKSQTITNIIAAAARDGKRVLFVAEKMAALSVVHDRLVRAGLREICLELHSRNANKKDVLAEVARTLASASAIPEKPDAPVVLTRARDKLNSLAEALHSPIGDSGETAFAALGTQARYIGQQTPTPVIGGEGLAAMPPARLQELLETVSHYGEMLVSEGSPNQHPFAGTRNLELQPVDVSRMKGLVTAARDAVQALQSASQSATTALNTACVVTLDSVEGLVATLRCVAGMPAGKAQVARVLLAASDLSRLSQTIRVGAAWRNAQDIGQAKFVDAAFSIPVAALRGSIAAGVDSFFRRWGGAYRGASRELGAVLRGSLPKRAAERLALLDMLGDIAALKAKWHADEAWCARVLGDVWRGEETDFAGLKPIVAWCAALSAVPEPCDHDAALRLADLPGQANNMAQAIEQALPEAKKLSAETIQLLQLDSEGGLEQSTLAVLAARLDAMAGASERYAGWCALMRPKNAIVAAGLADLAQKMDAGEMDGATALVELRFARAERLWQAARAGSPLLRDIAQENRHELVRLFAELERQHLKDNVTSIMAGHLGQVPLGAMGEMKVIRGELGKKRGHMAIRKLFSSAGVAMQRIKPVLLMSPISVAQFIPPGALAFDLLIIDEASQVRPEDALGAIARASQIVVVGDQKQLPPSSFFDRLLSDEAESEPEEGEEDLLGNAAKLGAMESILSLCEARGLASRMLTWHYRSRDPSLIQVSNQEFYDNGLILPPSPLQQNPDYGLCFTRVDGVYDKGGRRDNRIEGGAIVQRVAEHARRHPDLSLGIVTFSSAQRNLINELLELERRNDALLDAFLRTGRQEDLFVKNIENVQGDERDVILVSVCYGPVEAGGRLTSMQFGPVNGEGGERRLNVLFTRARLRCEVFASFDPADIDAARTSRDGVRILKHFLESAHGSNAAAARAAGVAAQSPLELDVAEAVRSLGYLTDPQLGSDGFRIDMGVRHPDSPDTYVMAVECDGATYHGALWARERDRLRRDVLEHLGWRFHRIWSTDWFYNRAAEIERLSLALEQARVHASGGVQLKGANHGQAMVVAAPVEPAPAIEVPAIRVRQMPVYQRAYFQISGSKEPHEVPVKALSELAMRIVKEEGPIHLDEAARRIAACFGKEKAGARITSTTQAALDFAQQNGHDVRTDEGFWFTGEQALAPPVRDRSAETGATVKPASISLLEIQAALKIAREDNGGGDDAEAIRAAARLLGFRRAGPDLQQRITQAL